MSKSKEKKISSSKSQKTNPDENYLFFRWVAVFSVILLGIIIYYNSFDCSFQFDDKHNIIDNMPIRSLSAIGEIWQLGHSRFVGYYSFAINYHFGELNVWGYHFVNLIIHLLNACLVFWFTLQLFRTPVLKDHALARHKSSISWVVALMFISHPLATGAVTYIVQRLASLVTFFYFLSLFFYLKGRLGSAPRSYRYFFFSLLAALFAIHTKENAYTLPFAVLLIELFFFTPAINFKNFKQPKYIITGLGIVSFVLFTVSSFSFSVFNPLPPSTFNTTTITSSNYFYTQVSVIVKYIQLLILPVNQNIDYDFPIANTLFNAATLINALILLSLLALAIYFYDRQRIFSFGIFWFFLTLSIESSFIPISDVIFEHRTYLPSFGFFLILSCALYQFLWHRNRNAVVLIFIFLIGTYAVMTTRRNQVWKDEFTLWSDAISKSPNKARPYLNRGYAYGKIQQWDKAISDFNKVNEIQPDYHATAFYNLGIAYWALGQKEKSLACYSKAVTIDSNYADAYYGRGVSYFYLNDIDRALADYSKAISLLPRPELFFNRGMVYAAKQMWQEALADYSKAISITPDKAVLYYNRGVVYGNINQWDKAFADFTKTLELDPQNKTANSNREYAYSKMRALSSPQGR
jgi:tetratricopeptide (TPR) repeat protein